MTDSNKEIAELKPRISAIEDEASNLKVQISVLANENVRLTTELSAVKHNLQQVESKETRKNVILWNVSASDVESAKNVFEKVVKDGLEYEQNCDFSVLEYGKEKKFIKIEMHSIETRLALLKNAKKLNRKVVMNFSNIYLTDDMPLSVRETRQKLLALRKKINDCQIRELDVWVTKSVPPLLCIRRHANAPVDKYTMEQIPDNFLSNIVINSKNVQIPE